MCFAFAPDCRWATGSIAKCSVGRTGRALCSADTDRGGRHGLTWTWARAFYGAGRGEASTQTASHIRGMDGYAPGSPESLPTVLFETVHPVKNT